jgi:hypothetical protein
LLASAFIAVCCLHLQAVAYWSKGLRAAGGSVESLQAVIEKSVVLGLATNTAAASNSLADIVTTYAGTLATQVRVLPAAVWFCWRVSGHHLYAAECQCVCVHSRLHDVRHSSLMTLLASFQFAHCTAMLCASGNVHVEILEVLFASC